MKECSIWIAGMRWMGNMYEKLERVALGFGTIREHRSQGEVVIPREGRSSLCRNVVWHVFVSSLHGQTAGSAQTRAQQVSTFSIVGRDRETAIQAVPAQQPPYAMKPIEAGQSDLKTYECKGA